MNDVTNKINELMSSLTEDEKRIVNNILKEFGEQGKSLILEKLKYKDYKEIPVDLMTFITDDNYLGKAWRNSEGKLKVYPFWLDILKKLFPTNIDTNYSMLLETGARGIGKSEIACGIIAPYLLYRILCLKDPASFYDIKSTEKITFAFMNIKLELTEEIALDKFQKNIQLSPWFMSKGKMTTYKNSPYWIPPEPLELVIGSQSDDVVGRPIFFCLDEDTIIKTSLGNKRIKDLVDIPIKVYSIDDNGDLILSDKCTVKPTMTSQEEIQIELEDGSIIKCTPNHRLMLKDGSYKEAQYLTDEDELFDYNISYKEFIENIINTRGQWNIPKDEYYEVHHIIPRCLGGEGVIRKRRKSCEHPNLIYLYPEEHFIAHKLLALENPNNLKLVCAWSMMAFPKGRTQIQQDNRKFEIFSKDYKLLKELQSEICKKNNNYLNNGVPWNKGLTKETDERVKKYSEQSKGKNTWCKGLVRSQETRNKMSIAQKARDKSTYTKNTLGKVAINNGKECHYINKNDILPEGYTYGQGKHKSYRIKDREKFIKMRRDLSIGEKNPMYGKGYKLSGGKNGHNKYIYTFEGKDYECRKYLIEELNSRGIDISNSAFRRIESGNYTKRISDKYQYVIDNLSWRPKDENKKNN